MLLYDGPLLEDGGIGEQAHDYGAAFAGFLDGEKSLAGNPSVGDGLVECLALTLADDHIEAVVFQVKALARALDSVAEHCYSFAGENLAGFFKRKFVAGDDCFLDPAEI